MSSLPSINKCFALAVKNYAKTNIKVYLPCPISSNFTFPNTFCRLSENIFGHNSSQSPSIFPNFSSLKILSQAFNINIKQKNCEKIPSLKVFSKHRFACLVWVKKNGIRKLLTLFRGGFS